MLIKNNKIPSKRRLEELLIDYLVIALYLFLLFILALGVYFAFLKRIPEFTEFQTQFIAIFFSVIPIILIFSYLDYRKGTLGKRMAGLELVFKEKTFGKSLLRNILKFFPWQLGHMATIHGVYSNYDILAILLSIISISLMILYLLMAFFREDKRHLPDLIAGTQVQLEEKSV